MLCRLAKLLSFAWLAGVLSGLCAPVHAITTAASATLAPLPAAASIPEPVPVRIALLLPLHSDSLGAAADALRAGFMAAYDHESDGITVTVLEAADGQQNTLTAYANAIAQYDIVVGPLARAAVTAVAQSGLVSKPTIALTQPEASAESDAPLPQQMLAIGLSIEDEARQLADWAAVKKKSGKAFVISTSVAWQRRAAKAFAAQWQHLGLEQQPVEMGMSSGYLSASGLEQLKTLLETEKPALLFVAMDAVQARQMRAVIGKESIFYGTSQMNPLNAADWTSADHVPQMNGVRLVDIPWQLQPDHPAVMIYPRLVVGADQKRSPELDRLYALGIDAFRIAREVAAHHAEFELDGVTGRLSVSFGKGAPHFQRLEQPAMYQDGVVAPLLR